MKEADWLNGKYPSPMILSLFSRYSRGGPITDERFRRFGIACTRRVVAALPEGKSPALDLLEASIGPGLKGKLAEIRKLHHAQLKSSTQAPFEQRARHFASRAVLKCVRGKPTLAAMAYEEALSAVIAMRGHTEGWEPGGWPHHPQHRKAEDTECAVQADLLRDIFPNPFQPRPVLHPDWRTSTVVALARQMFDSQDFSAMPILADALQDAGCDNEHILSHCRDTSLPHVRGCWVVDLVLTLS